MPANQEDERPLAGGEPPARGPGSAASGMPPPPGGDEPPAVPAHVRVQRGLVAWFLVVTVPGLALLALGRPDDALLFAFAGLFALAQASDAAAAIEGYGAWMRSRLPPGDAAGALLRGIAAAAVPLLAAATYALFAAWMVSEHRDATHRLASAWCVGAAIACAALAFRGAADAAARVLFRVSAVTRTQRLAARIAIALLLLPVPSALVTRDLLDLLSDRGAVVDAPGLIAQLAGELALAFAGVGLWVRRDARAALGRLGLGPMSGPHWTLAGLGLVAAVALNAGMDAIERRWLPGLWALDGASTRIIASGLTPAVALLLGVSAGVGEELMVRGALQPRTGLLLASLLFASGHVQYTWFGMLTIGLLGLLLGTVRARANTTTAIVVHALYDVYAAVSSG